MSLTDWLITLIPLAFVMGIGFYVRKYTRGVANFVQAGRLCGRYVICVGDIANALSIIGIVTYIEMHYKTGFGLAFWEGILAPLTIIISLYGFCTYRYRETKALSFGQFLEMRYSRKFRIFACALRSFTEIVCNMIMPALAARFFIYYLGLPQTIPLFGVECPSFILVAAIALALAITLICLGGTLCLVVTDAIQGIMLYPMMIILILFIWYKFSWSGEIVQVMQDRAPGESFLNPYDIQNLSDFNIFFLIVMIFNAVVHRASWFGGGTSGAAKSPHEQKMAGVLGTWRNTMNVLVYILIAVAVLTFMNHRNWAADAEATRIQLSGRIAEELITDPGMRRNFSARIAAVPAPEHEIGKDAPLSDRANLDTPYMDAARQAFLDIEKQNPAALKDGKNGNAVFAQYRTLYHQQMLAVSTRKMFPKGMVGMFCLFMILGMLSTDDTRIFGAALTITQDCILPFVPKLSPGSHIWIFRLVSIGIGIFFLCGAFLMSQLDYVYMWSALITMIWMGGSGPISLFGLYSRFGTTIAAWTTMLTGMACSVLAIAVQRNWPDYVYPWLRSHNWTESVGNFLETVSEPFHPYIVWEMNPVKCPVNSVEMTFIVAVFTLILYVVVSYLTMKEPFNLDRMLHRGIYNTDGDNKTGEKLTRKNLFRKLIGITPEYTRGDRIIAWSIFLYTFVYSFGLMFVGVIVWNFFAPWSKDAWGTYFLIYNLLVPGVIALISTFWFGIGGVIDMFRLFRDLEKQKINDKDNGIVEGHVSLADVSEFQKLEAGIARKNGEQNRDI